MAAGGGMRHMYGVFNKREGSRGARGHFPIYHADPTAAATAGVQVQLSVSPAENIEFAPHSKPAPSH